MGNNTITVFHELKGLTGHGEEWYINKAGDIAVFINGQLKCQVIQIKGNSEKTKVG